MNENSTVSVPKWYWAASTLMLLWNLMGLAVFGLTVAMLNNEELLTQATATEAQVEAISSTPIWVNIAFGVAVIFGVLGSIALLMRRKLAFPLFVISLLGVLAQNAYVFLLSDTVEKMGAGLSPLVIAVAVLIVPLSAAWTKKGWLR